MRRFLGCVVLMVAVGCGSEDGEELPEVDCASGVPTYAAVTAFPKCATCHSSSLTGASRQLAPESVNFDTYAGASANPEKAVEEVHEGEMPPAGSGVTLTEEEKQALYKWGLCGNPM